MNLKPLRLARHADRRIRVGHLWVFSNEVDVKTTPLTAFEPGELAQLLDARGAPLAVVYVNPKSLICARVLTRNATARIDAGFFSTRINTALTLRERLYPATETGSFYRLLFSEADTLPGLTLDRFGDVIVAQSTTAGIDAQRAAIDQAIQDTLAPAGVLWKNDAPVRELEGLAMSSEVIGTVPDTVTVVEDGLKFEVPLAAGQKTGWYFDQRENRAQVRSLARGARVLDVFSYVGGFGVSAAAGGAESVLCVDASQAALDAAKKNATLNQCAIETRCGDARDTLRALKAEGAQFDLVVVDPPALIKRKKDIKAGTRHYQQLNALAMSLLSEGGILVAASCSHHLSADAMQRALLGASSDANRRLSILARRGAAMDHPVHPAIPETEYLKAFFCSI